ncbi:YraN family protein [Miltoncostaea marina]|uniref:YraN family protein n=1 Tax=Miltoncostaea marina TaxID=2843215 RepID=UPI001C3D47D2|nr:YraN family protein [Miltoncostaea marina]
METRAERGVRGERAAARHLRRRGWTILATRWRGGGGELDLVAARGRVVAVCEVKTRADDGALAEPLTAAQRGRMARAARAFLARRPELAGHEVRLDLIAVRAGRLRARVRHRPGAAGPP